MVNSTVNLSSFWVILSLKLGMVCYMQKLLGKQLHILGEVPSGLICAVLCFPVFCAITLAALFSSISSIWIVWQALPWFPLSCTWPGYYLRSWVGAIIEAHHSFFISWGSFLNVLKTVVSLTLLIYFLQAVEWIQPLSPHVVQELTSPGTLPLPERTAEGQPMFFRIGYLADIFSRVS